MTIAVGQEAPDFELPNQFGEPVSLSSFRGRSSVALVFFPLAFSRTCAGELEQLRDNSELFTDAGVEILGISVDSKHALRVWSEAAGFRLQLLSDFWPHGEVARRYGAFREATGVAARTTVFIDSHRNIRSVFSAPATEPRPLSAYREAIQAL